MIAIKELKLPMLKHSRAVSIQYSTTRTRCFFFACWKSREKFLIMKRSRHSLFFWELRKIFFYFLLKKF